MLLIYIENKQLLTKIITYLDNLDISYTTDFNCEYESVLCAELSNKIVEFITKSFENNKKIYFLTYLEEHKIFINNKLKNKISRNYNRKLYNVLKKCDKIIVSLPSIKNIISSKILKEITVIQKELPIINISKYNKDIYNKYGISKRKRKIIVIDLDYRNIEIVSELANKYSKYNFVYIGFKSDYLLKDKIKDVLYHMPKNVTKVKYLDLNIFSDISKISYLIISFEDINLNIDYIYTSILFKKQLLIKNSELYSDYLINSKNCYLFKNKDDLFLRFKKIMEERVANLTDIAYDLIKDNTIKEISGDFGKLI